MYFPDRVKIIRKDPDPGNMDPYGNRPTLSEEEYPCRIDESSKVVKNQQGQEVVSTTQFLFSGRLSLSYFDELMWTDQSGEGVTRCPIAIERVRDGIGVSRLLAVSC